MHGMQRKTGIVCCDVNENTKDHTRICYMLETPVTIAVFILMCTLRVHMGILLHGLMCEFCTREERQYPQGKPKAVLASLRSDRTDIGSLLS